MFDTFSGGAARLVLALGGLGLFLFLEWIRPYRRPSVSKPKRWGINLGMTALNTVALNLTLAGAVLGAASWTAAHGHGLLHLVGWPRWLEVAVGVAFLDFAIYIWHFLNHKLPLLWRFHRVHHSDLNMDVSTATRFHVGELAMSAVLKMGLILFIGADVAMVLVFESALLLAAQFHHSMVAVPGRVERPLWWFTVPPSMHRIHHSVVIRERDSNYGTILSIWDRLAGTLFRSVDQDRIKIGVGAYRDPRKLGLGRLLAMPFWKPIR
jgi:sterol desaturase/sphingolipid hydroxylase (fatty acid hydroxylase superfamily)